MERYAYAWFTLGFFAISFGLHWLFGWFAFVDEAHLRRESPAGIHTDPSYSSTA